MQYYQQNALMHYGIKGQKWGIRRFQNEDGTLTVAGKERYGSGKTSNNSGHGNGATARMTPGVTGGLSPRAEFAVRNLAGPVTFIGKRIHRKINAKKEVAEFGLNTAEKTRVTKKDIDTVVRYRRKARREIWQRMKDNPEMSFEDSRKQTHRKEIRRILGQAALINLASVATYFAMQNPNVRNTVQNAKNGIQSMVQTFMKKAAWKKMNAVELRSNEYSITDAYEKLPKGRG